MPNNESDKVDHPRFMRRAEAARYLQQKWGLPAAARTLAKLACISSEGPEMHYAGRIPLYTPEALDRYAERRIGPARGSTSQAGRGRGALDAPSA
jgi:hypothetical protein